MKLRVTLKVKSIWDFFLISYPWLQNIWLALFHWCTSSILLTSKEKYIVICASVSVRDNISFYSCWGSFEHTTPYTFPLYANNNKSAYNAACFWLNKEQEIHLKKKQDWKENIYISSIPSNIRKKNPQNK